jgi:hypothetical protein
MTPGEFMAAGAAGQSGVLGREQRESRWHGVRRAGWLAEWDPGDGRGVCSRT